MVIKIKELTFKDLEKYGVDFYKTLDNLVLGNEFNLEKAKATLKKIKSNNGHIFIAIFDKKIVGTTTILLEQKFIRNQGLSAHIEDVSVRTGYEGKGIASLLLEKSISFAKEKNCYKIILNCNKELINFYSKFGFEEKEVEMKMYLKD